MTSPFSPKSGTTDVLRLQKQVEQLSQRLALLESALKVTPGEVLLKASGTLKLQGAMIHLN